MLNGLALVSGLPHLAGATLTQAVLCLPVPARQTVYNFAGVHPGMMVYLHHLRTLCNAFCLKDYLIHMDCLFSFVFPLWRSWLSNSRLMYTVRDWDEYEEELCERIFRRRYYWQTTFELSLWSCGKFSYSENCDNWQGDDVYAQGSWHIAAPPDTFDIAVVLQGSSHRWRSISQEETRRQTDDSAVYYFTLRELSKWKRAGNVEMEPPTSEDFDSYVSDKDGD